MKFKPTHNELSGADSDPDISYKFGYSLTVSFLTYSGSSKTTNFLLFDKISPLWTICNSCHALEGPKLWEKKIVETKIWARTALEPETGDFFWFGVLMV